MSLRDLHFSEGKGGVGERRGKMGSETWEERSEGWDAIYERINLKNNKK